MSESKELAKKIKQLRTKQWLGLPVDDGATEGPDRRTIGQVTGANEGPATGSPKARKEVSIDKTKKPLRSPGVDEKRPSEEKIKERQEEIDKKYKDIDDGYFQINDIDFTIPPEQISIQKNIKNVSMPVLRASTSQKIRTGHGFIQVSVPLTFVGRTDVNSKLVPLVYALRRQPFCWVESKYLRKVLMPISYANSANKDTSAMMFALQSLTVQTVENLPTTVQCFLQLLWFNYLPYTSEIQFREKWNVPAREGGTRAGPTSMTGYRENDRRNVARQRSLQNLNNANLKRDKVKFYDELQDPVRNPKQSQAWLEFIKGATVYNVESDDWGPQVPASRYFSMEYRRYAAGSSAPAGYKLEDPTYGVYYKDLKFFSSDDFNPIHVSVGFQNRIAALPLLEQQLPTAQFMGSSDRMVTMTFFVTPDGQGQMTEFNKMIQDYENQVIEFRQYSKDMYLKFWNPIAAMCGISTVVPDSIHTETVPGNPGSSVVRVTFSEYNPSSHPEPIDVEGREEKILREFVMSAFGELGAKGDVIQDADIRGLTDEVFTGQVGRPIPKLVYDLANPLFPEFGTQPNTSRSRNVNAPDFSKKDVPGKWIYMKISRQEVEPDKTDIWDFCWDLTKMTYDNREGFAYASDRQTFGLKTYAGLPLYQDPGALEPDWLARQSQKLFETMKGHVENTLLGPLGRSKFYKLSREYIDTDRDTEPCYPDMELPDHPVDPGSSLYTEPDFYFYNPELVPEFAQHTDAKKMGDRNRKAVYKLLKANSETDLNKDDVIKEHDDVYAAKFGQRNRKRQVDLSSIQGTDHLKEVGGAIKTAGHFDSTDRKQLGPEGEIYTVTSENIYNTAVEDVKKNRELGMRKAFPTFRIHFVREGRNKTTLRGFHQSYGGFAVSEIRFIASRKSPTDTCVITLANLDGFIETDDLDDIRSEDKRYGQDRLSTDSKNFMYDYDDIIDAQLIAANQKFASNIDDWTIRRVIEYVRNNPPPGGHGPMGLTIRNAFAATGRDYTATQLEVHQTNFSIAIPIMARWSNDFPQYSGDSRLGEVIAALYMFPELEGEIKEGIDRTAVSGSISNTWLQNIANQDLQKLVAAVRAQDNAESQKRRLKIQKESDALKKKKKDLELKIAGVDTSTVVADAVDVGLVESPETNRLREQLNLVKDRLAELQRELDEFIKRPPGEGIIFKEGTDIILQLGYSNNPSNLEVVFVGHVTEAHPGPGTVTLICQTFATEFLQEIKGVEDDMTLSESWILGGRDVDGPRIAEWILTQPEVKHFGRWDNREESSELARNVRGRSALAWRVRNTVVDDNVYLEEDPIFDWNSSYFTLNERTLWQGLQDLSFRFPGYIVGVRPYKDQTWWRNTLFVGRPDFTYLWNTPRDIEQVRRIVSDVPGIRSGDFAGISGLPNVDAEIWTPKTKPTIFAQLTDVDVVEVDMGYSPLQLQSGVQTSLLPGAIDPGPQHDNPDDRNELQAELDDLQKARRQFFRRYHMLTSYHDIIDNGIILTKRGISNAVRLQGRGARQFYEKKLDFMDDQYRKWLDVRNDNAMGDNDVGNNMATSILMWHLRDIYQGEITILGDPSIRPYDVCYILDDYNDFAGPVEVEQVVHTLNSEVGFITQIVPDLYNTISDLPTRTNISAFGVYAYRWYLGHQGILQREYDQTERSSEAFLRQQNPTGVAIGLERHGLDGDSAGAALGGALLWTGVAGVMRWFPLWGAPLYLGAYFLGGYLKGHATIRIVPLMHKGHPYVTGLQGFEAPESFDILLNQWQSWRKGVQKRWKATSEFARQAFDPLSSGVVGDYIIEEGLGIDSPILP